MAKELRVIPKKNYIILNYNLIKEKEIYVTERMYIIML